MKGLSESSDNLQITPNWVGVLSSLMELRWSVGRLCNRIWTDWIDVPRPVPIGI